MNKKAQGLSMNVIIIAAIALLVLVILATFLLKSGGEVNKGTSCEGMNGECEDREDCVDYGIASGQKNCPDDTVCCIPIGQEE